MSWSINITGTADEIGKEFDAQREQHASWGMVAAEQLDIEDARDFAMTFAEKYNRVRVNAAGHWVMFGPDDPRNGFGQVSITIAPAS